MEQQPQISVLMTSYNHAPYVEERVRSVLAQTWGNFDLTVSDNGSVDGSWDILKRLEAERPNRMRVVRGPGHLPDNHFSLVVNAEFMTPWSPYVTASTEAICTTRGLRVPWPFSKWP